MELERYKEIPHWATKLQPGDRCLATIRHATDGSKNRIDQNVIVCKNDTWGKRIVALFDGEQVKVPYDELSEIMARELHGLLLRIIAVKIPETAENIRLFGCYVTGVCKSGGFRIWAFDSGEWEIVGLADKMTGKMLTPFFHSESTEITTGPIEKLLRWEFYCRENKLTNELILIQK